MPITILRNFLRLESAGGIVLFLAALLAMVLDNSFLSESYRNLLQTPLTTPVVNISFSQSLLYWINNGLMAVFFLLVTVELRRQFLEGELSSRSQVVLPSFSALGGMIVPAVMYLMMNGADPTLMKGWPIPVATDIAFVLGVLSLLGHRVPLGLKVFVMALSIFDDVGAIAIIAILHSNSLSTGSLWGVIVCILVLQLLKSLKVQRLSVYLMVGFLLWLCVLKSGIHATIAGVVLALMIPAEGLYRLEKKLHPWVAFLVMPLFAFANAGVSFAGMTITTLLNPLTMGVMIGLVIGKQIGVFASAGLLVKCRLARLPAETSWLQLYGAAMLCGIGFTMSLFLGTLAFEVDGPLYLVNMRLGVLMGSVLAGSLGAIILICAFQRRSRYRVRRKYV